ncbi:unnamed protein product [Adineta steineri]|uniref:G-protein coupled receptors family 1 profile domain-containing protein n=1 Tax=Adineta steineri TaxID=433720 RepID=A0A818X2U8_9BILA|nr:unnamed protein product [Adineta steineri]CAF3733660.1 unnamed protein product [Adineta steineri]
MSLVDDTITLVVFLVISFVNFFLGIFGLTFNILVFTRPTLRREPCSLYFLTATCFIFFVILIIIPVRMISIGFNIDVGNENTRICKIEFFTFYTVRAICSWLITLICIDRYLHSSSNASIRRLSSLKNAKLTIGIICIIIPIFYSHTYVFLNLKYVIDQYGNVVSSCVIENSIYSTFIALWHLALYSLCPSFLMLVFGGLTLKHLRQRRRLLAQPPENNQMHRRVHIHLL